jgi:hypothetical protein
MATGRVMMLFDVPAAQADRLRAMAAECGAMEARAAADVSEPLRQRVLELCVRYADRGMTAPTGAWDAWQYEHAVEEWANPPSDALWAFARCLASDHGWMDRISSFAASRSGMAGFLAQALRKGACAKENIPDLDTLEPMASSIPATNPIGARTVPVEIDMPSPRWIDGSQDKVGVALPQADVDGLGARALIGGANVDGHPHLTLRFTDGPKGMKLIRRGVGAKQGGGDRYGLKFHAEAHGVVLPAWDCWIDSHLVEATGWFAARDLLVIPLPPETVIREQGDARC